MLRTWLLALPLALLGACSGCDDGGDEAACAAGLTSCDGGCVDLDLDDANCGACGVACPGDRVCAAGSCELSCGTDRLVCGDLCVPYLVDPLNCGACDVACDPGTACEGGLCEIQCTAPASRCGSEAAGLCVDLSSDPAHCGDCETACGAAEECALGICEITCAPPTVRCGSGAAATCVDPASDPAHCGSCAVACDAGESCRFATCTTGACLDLRLPGPSLSAAGDAPATLAAGDFDGDGLTDLAVADASPTAGSRLLLLAGRGDGTFGAPVLPALPDGLLEALQPITALVSGDLDGDAVPDLVVATSAAGTATLQPLLGDGAGGFTAPAGSALASGGSPQTIALADLDRDGWPDLLVGDGAAQASANFRVFLNDGTGLLGLPPAASGDPRTPDQAFDVGAGVRGIGSGDVNADGYPDAVVAWDGTGGAGGEVLLGSSGGALSRPLFNGQPTHDFDLAEPGPTSLAVADLNEDGFADWVVGHAATNAVTIQLADPLDAGKPGLTSAIYAVAGPRGLLVARLDADGRPDLVTVNAWAGALHYHRNAGPLAGGVAFDPPVVLPVGHRPVAAVLAAAAPGGEPFLFAANAGTGHVSATPAPGDGTFDAPIRYPAGQGTRAIALGHFDGDATLDLATADVSSDRVQVWLEILLGLPGGAFGTPSPPIPLPEGGAPVSLVSADLDADGSADLAVALEGTAQVAVLWGDGSGAFPASQTHGVGAQPEQVLVSDLDADGLPDLVTADAGSNQLSVLRGIGGRNFVTSTLPASAGPRAVAAMRLGPGTCTDLVSANATAGTLTVHPCDPVTPGLFLAPFDVAACPGARALAPADLDGDGVADLAAACDAGIAVFRSPGDGTLDGLATFDAGGTPRSLSAGDLDGDGRPDLLAAVPGAGGLTVLHGAAGLAFSPPRRWAVGGEPLAAIAADVDGDGRSDACVAAGNPEDALFGAGAVLLRSGCLPAP